MQIGCLTSFFSPLRTRVTGNDFSVPRLISAPPGLWHRHRFHRRPRVDRGAGGHRPNTAWSAISGCQWDVAYNGLTEKIALIPLILIAIPKKTIN